MIIILTIAAILIVVTGVFLYRRKRRSDELSKMSREKSRTAFRELERIRLETFPEPVKKEISRVIKDSHPEANRHERRTVAVRYRRMIKNS